MHYRSAIRNLPSHLQAVQNLTRDNPLQQARFLNLDSTVQNRLAFIATIVQAQRQHQGALAQALIKTGEGKRLHDLARSQVTAMLATEADLLVQRRNAARQNINIYLCLFSVDMVISLLLIFFVIYRLWHELRLRLSTESALRLSNADLVAANASHNAILDSAPYSVIAMDMEGVIHTFNKAAVRML
ncbi:MAG: CHASE3 domain-containing protein [Candidatus Saccharibacteria bacterium]|nr:CHASE3 domain-containing protein [Moraxellaceae bacterium]